MFRYPSPNGNKAADFAAIQNIITESRFIQSALKVSGVTLYYTNIEAIANNADTIKRLARLRDVTEVEDGTGLYLTTSKYRCWLDIDQSTAAAYLNELIQQQERQQAVITQLQSRLANTSYVKQAPHAVVTQTKEQLAAAEELLASLKREHARFSTPA